MSGLELRACAKINLNLKVLGRREDGFHDIASVAQSISLADRLSVEPTTRGIELEVDDPSIPADRANLVWQAADLLRETADGARTLGTRIRLHKRIPAGAGLGGGSSDCAAVLVALNELWNMGLTDTELSGLAARLGSDVPYFLHGGTALIRGRGTEVEPLPDLVGYHLLIVHPGVPLTSREVYAQLSAPLTPATKIDTMTDFRPIIGSGLEACIGLGNDLSSHARRLCPVIGEIEQRLLAAGAAAAAMTGSGSAVFGVFRDRAPLQAAARIMALPGWSVMMCEPVSRKEFRRHPGLAHDGDAPSRRDVGYGDH